MRKPNHPARILERVIRCPLGTEYRFFPYEGPMGAVVKQDQMASRTVRWGDKLVRIDVTIADPPPSEQPQQVDIEEEILQYGNPD